jgi:hypothetical protein
MAHDDDVPLLPPRRAVRGEELFAGNGDALVDVGERLSALRPELTLGPPLLPDSRRDLTQRLTLELSVVDLHPPLVHRDRDAEVQQVCRGPGPAEWARPHLGDRIAQQCARRDRLGIARVGQLGVRAAEQESLGIGHRLAVADQDQHGCLLKHGRPLKQVRLLKWE